ncbi:MAG TPA: hypothetical protein DEG71_00040 [Clostridiales bacterium]|nr:hypothetical protein [Clostridiales bacterium]
MNKLILNSIFNLTNSIILVLTIIISIIFQIEFKSASAPIILGGIFIVLSILYNLQINKRKLKSPNEYGAKQLRELASQKHDNLTPIIKKLVDTMERLKHKSQNNSKFLFVSKLVDDICDFERIIPILVENYRQGAKFLKQRSYKLSIEINNIESNLNSSTGTVKETYAKTLAEKKQANNEMHDIQNTLNECESKLHYILSTLQKIEATVESSDIKDNNTDQEMQEVSTQLEVFSESVKDVVTLMKI